MKGYGVGMKGYGKKERRGMRGRKMKRQRRMAKGRRKRKGDGESGEGRDGDTVEGESEQSGWKVGEKLNDELRDRQIFKHHLVLSTCYT